MAGLAHQHLTPRDASTQPLLAAKRIQFQVLVVNQFVSLFLAVVTASQSITFVWWWTTQHNSKRTVRSEQQSQHSRDVPAELSIWVQALLHAVCILQYSEIGNQHALLDDTMCCMSLHFFSECRIPGQSGI